MKKKCKDILVLALSVVAIIGLIFVMSLNVQDQVRENTSAIN